jgi:hypothetical protein
VKESIAQSLKGLLNNHGSQDKSHIGLTTPKQKPQILNVMSELLKKKHEKEKKKKS